MEIFTGLISLLIIIINWIGFLFIISLIAGVALPFLYQNDTSVRIGIKNFTLIKIIRANDKINITIFH